QKPGRYTIFYEYEGVADGRVFATGERPPALQLELASTETKAAIPLVGSGLASAPYSAAGASGVALMDLVIDRPRAHELSARPSGDAQAPEVILAVGHEALRQNMSMWLQLAGGALLCLGSLFAGGMIALLTLVQRVKPGRSPSPRR